jgi:hypothetical protein
MIQTIIVIIILLAALTGAVIKLYRFVKGLKSGNPCSPDKCFNCPYNTNNTCTEPERTDSLKK